MQNCEVGNRKLGSSSTRGAVEAGVFTKLFYVRTMRRAISKVKTLTNSNLRYRARRMDSSEGQKTKTGRL